MDIGLKEILTAHQKMQGIVKRTPFDASPILSEVTGGEVWLKCENYQTTGSFKLRGAVSRMTTLTDEEKARGVVTASAGNHAQGVAYVARRLGIDAKIVIPENGSKTKIENTRRMGANVVIAGRDYDASEAKAWEISKEEGRTYVHAFNDPYIWAGQGTVGLEMMQDAPDLDIVLVPAGGGGLIRGIATAVKAINPAVKVIAIQPETSTPWYTSFKNGAYTHVEMFDSLADGLTGDIAPEMVPRFNELIDEVYLVSEEEVAKGMFWLAKQQHMLVEGSGAVGVSLLLEGKLDVKGKKVGVVLTGSNVDTKIVKDILNKYEQ
ncbi:pyridoxal-phosphate dependent enzyme [Ruminococcaceae bacterium OttesenSCG-928-D13]|nr:pyridoxal-phosphate dependent enzyme [Ruminococcaceae bacterium OttesenSCG-928-D13]